MLAERAVGSAPGVAPGDDHGRSSGSRNSRGVCGAEGPEGGADEREEQAGLVRDDARAEHEEGEDGQRRCCACHLPHLPPSAPPYPRLFRAERTRWRRG